MSEATLPRFACEGCAKSYKWKPELSHKRVKCKCGTVMTVPDLTPPAEDAPPALPDDDIFALIDNAPTGESQAQRMVAEAAAAPPPPKEKKAKPQSARGAAAVATLAGRPGAGAPVLGYRGGPTPTQPGRPRRGSFEEMYDLKRDIYVPTGLITGSFLIYFAWLLIHGTAGTGESLAFYGGLMFAVLAVKTVLMIGGAFIVAPMAGVSFGPFWTAILKLAALTVTTDVLVTVVEQAIGAPGAGIVAGSLGLACYWGLMSYLFQFDAAEAWWVVVLFGVLRWLLTMLLAFVVMGMVLSGRDVSANFGGGGGGSSAASVTQEAREFDETIAEMKENNLVEEGTDYIKRTGRQSGQTELINKLYDAGAKSVSFTLAKDINGKSEPLSLAVEWPRDAKKRAAVLAAINDYFKQQAAEREKRNPDWGKVEPEVLTDTGGKYIELDVIMP